MKLVGLTGGIASGKTLVSDRFATHGVPVIDADLLARQVVEPGTDGLKALVESLGPGILDPLGALDRAALRKRIFDHPGDRSIVEGHLHPRIRALSDEQIHQADDGNNRYLIYAVPLLFETKQQERFDRILVVDVPVELQMSRLMARDKHSREQAQAILNSQASREQRLSIADDIILNDAGVEQALGRVDELHSQYTSMWN